MSWAFHDVNLVKTSLERLRQRIDTFHHALYEEILRLAGIVDIEERSPRVACRQQNRQNAPSDNCEEYYKCNITIPILDHLISELNNQFDNSSAFSSAITEFMKLLPSEITKSKALLIEKDFPFILQTYKDDLPFYRGLDTELDIWVK